MILVDTTGLWGLVFEDSKYHKFIINELSGKIIYVIDAQILELFRVIYRAFSGHGKRFNDGLNKLIEVSEFLENKLYEMKGVRIVYLKTGYGDYIEAIRIIAENPEIFAREGPRGTLWPEIIDAIIAVIWRRNRATLYTKDEALISFGEKEKLSYVPIRQG